jgi:hypothetical protein
MKGGIPTPPMGGVEAAPSHLARWSVSEHCVDRYLERVAPPSLRRSPDARRLALLELLVALSQPALVDLEPVGGGRLLGLVNPAGYPFMVKATASPDGSEMVAESCGPRWFWHEARRYWRALGYECSKGNPQTRAAARLRRLARRAEEQQAKEAGDADRER